LNATKVSPGNVGGALFINLTLNGVHTVSRAFDFFVSAVHNEDDIKKSVEALDMSLDTMISEGIF
jgi:hypothetical protein